MGSYLAVTVHCKPLECENPDGQVLFIPHEVPYNVIQRGHKEQELAMLSSGMHKRAGAVGKSQFQFQKWYRFRARKQKNHWVRMFTFNLGFGRWESDTRKYIFQVDNKRLIVTIFDEKQPDKIKVQLQVKEIFPPETKWKHKRVRIKLDRIKDNAGQFKTAKFRGCGRWFYYDDTDNVAAATTYNDYLRGVSPFEHFVSIAAYKLKQREIDDLEIDAHWEK